MFTEVNTNRKIHGLFKQIIKCFKNFNAFIEHFQEKKHLQASELVQKGMRLI